MALNEFAEGSVVSNIVFLQQRKRAAHFHNLVLENADMQARLQNALAHMIYILRKLMMHVCRKKKAEHLSRVVAISIAKQSTS